jgi:hypothetical protein
MQSRQFWIGAACASVTVVAVAATALFRPINLHHGVAPAAGRAPLHAFGGHDWKAGKTGGHLDAMLAHIADRAAGLHAGTAVAELRSLNPAARFRQASAGATPQVLIDAATRGDPKQLKTALESLGLEHASVFANSVGGWLPVTSIAAAAADSHVAFIHASLPHKRAAVALQGDYVQHSYALRQSNPSLTGSGITVGVLSDSFDCYAVYAAPNSGVPASGLNGYASNGFTATAADDEGDGALPATVNVLAEPYNSNGGPGSTGGGAGNCLDYDAPDQLPFSDEGRAMLQIVHVVAPDASLAFYTGDDSETDFANGILKLASPVSSGGAGAKVIADDLGYYDEPFYQDGIVAQAIDTVEAAGVAYFSAAGNNANASWESTSPSFTTQQPTNAANNAGEYLLNFDTTRAVNATALPITIGATGSGLVPGEYVAIVVEWDQPYVTGAPGSGGAQNQIDLCVTGAPSNFVVQDFTGANTNCTGLNAIGSDPVQVIILGNPANATANTAQVSLNIVVGTKSLTNPPGRLIVSVETDGQTSPAPISLYATNSETIQGHPNATGAAAVAAAFYFDTPQCGTTPAKVEDYSSLGGAPILFSTTGARLATPELRQKPNFVGPDGVNNTFLGFTLESDGVTNGQLQTTNPQCQNNASYPNFFGTSAATPHAAGIAALMLQANPQATPAQIYTALETSALPIGTPPTSGANPTYNFTAGYGFIQADAALSQPSLTLATTTIPLGASTTLTWSTIEASSCTASGDWSGTLAAQGTQTVTPTATGIATYTLTCTNGTTQSTPVSVSLSVGEVPPAPTLTLSASSVVAGGTTTISWSSTYATACTASGSWTGTRAASGSQILTAPATAGTYTYSLACTNATGSSTTTSVSLTVTEAPPATPTLTLSATSIAVGSTATITWSSPTATSCTASGSWSGTLATSGTQTVSPTATGTDTYDLVCSNSGGASLTASTTLNVTAKPSSGGGGGAWNAAWVFVFGAIAAVTRRRRAVAC